jgi:hypothetical protein
MSFYLCTTCNLTNPEKSVDKRVWNYQGSIHTWYFWFLRLYIRMHTNPFLQILWDHFPYITFIIAIVFLTSSEDADVRYSQVTLLAAIGLTIWALQNFIPISLYPFSMENTMTTSSNSAIVNSVLPLINIFIYTVALFFFLGLLRYWNTNVLPDFYTTFSAVVSAYFFIFPIVVLVNRLFIMTYKDAPIVFDPANKETNSQISFGISANTDKINQNKNKKRRPQNVLIRGYAENLRDINIQTRIENYWQNRESI